MLGEWVIGGTAVAVVRGGSLCRARRVLQGRQGTCCQVNAHSMGIYEKLAPPPTSRMQSKMVDSFADCTLHRHILLHLVNINEGANVNDILRIFMCAAEVGRGSRLKHHSNTPEAVVYRAYSHNTVHSFDLFLLLAVKDMGGRLSVHFSSLTRYFKYPSSATACRWIAHPAGMHRPSPSPLAYLHCP
eukprot:355645-Chlamydomonas_euryale.AAC.10